VYVAGKFSEEGEWPRAVLWKNGAMQNITNAKHAWDADATSVFVHGGDIYVSGRENNIAKVWKNGVALLLPCEG
jgi:hypothetical protein